MMASVSMLGLEARGWGSGSDQAADQVGPRQEPDDHALAYHGEAVDVLRAHQVGDVRQGLVLRQAEYRSPHRFLDGNEPRVRRPALQLRTRGRPELTALGPLHEIGDQITQQLAMRDRSEERRVGKECRSRWWA